MRAERSYFFFRGGVASSSGGGGISPLNAGNPVVFSCFFLTVMWYISDCYVVYLLLQYCRAFIGCPDVP